MLCGPDVIVGDQREGKESGDCISKQVGGWAAEKKEFQPARPQQTSKERSWDEKDLKTANSVSNLSCFLRNDYM